MAKYLVIGAGYLGKRIISQLKADHEVDILTRSLRDRELFEEWGCKHHAKDIANSHFSHPMEDYDTIIFNPAPTVDRKKKNIRHALYVKGTGNVLRQMIRSGFGGRLIVVGSTSALKCTREFWESGKLDLPMGPTELLDCKPQNPVPSFTQLVQVAEAGKDHEFKTSVLLSAGIYGPERHPGRRVMQGLATTTLNPDARLKLLHIDDLSRAVLHLCHQTKGRKDSEQFILAEPESVSRQRLYELYSDKLEMPPVEFTPPTPEEIAQDPSWKSPGRPLDCSDLLNMSFELKSPGFEKWFASYNLRQEIIAPTP